MPVLAQNVPLTAGSSSTNVIGITLNPVHDESEAVDIGCFGFEQIFRNAMESERTYNHFKKRIFNVLPYRDDIEDMQTIRDYIHNHKF